MNKELFDQGLAIRREVIGADETDNAMKTADAFTRPMRDFVTQYCWGDIWARPGLPRKVRSLINLAMLTALNRPDELNLHVHGALNNGVTKEEIMEVFLQVTVYCGVPAGWGGFRVAQDVFAERGIDQVSE